MQLDTRIPFMGFQPDYVNALAQGQGAAMQRNEGARQNALAQLYQAQGPGIIAGEQGAVNALAALDPGAALGVMDTRQGMDARSLGMDATRLGMDATRQNMQQQAQEWAMTLDDRQRREAREGLQQAVQVLYSADTPEAWDAMALEMGKPEMVGQFARREQVILEASTFADAVARTDARREQPEFNPEQYRVVDGRLVDLNAEGGRPALVDLGEGAAPPAPAISPDQLTNANTLRDDLRSELQEFSTVQSSWQNIETFFTNPGGVSDYALAVAFAKILDPGSVAREGEVAAVANSGSLTDAIRRQVINAIEGSGQLPEAVRLEIAQLAAGIYNQRASHAQGIIKTYGNIARDAGLPVQTVYTGQMPQRAEPPTLASPPPPVPGPVGAPPPPAQMLPPPGPQPTVPAPPAPIGQTRAPTVNELSMMGAVPTSQFMPPPAQAATAQPQPAIQAIMNATRDELVRMDVTRMTPDELRAWNAAVDALEGR
jgi:hypothetical protein